MLLLNVSDLLNQLLPLASKSTSCLSNLSIVRAVVRAGVLRSDSFHAITPSRRAALWLGGPANAGLLLSAALDGHNPLNRPASAA